MGGKIIPRIRLTSAKVVVEVEAELGKILTSFFLKYFVKNFKVKNLFWQTKNWVKKILGQENNLGPQKLGKRNLG